MRTSRPGPVAVAILLLAAGAATAADLEVFTREGCRWCAQAERFLDDLRQEQPALRVTVRDVGRDPAAHARLAALAARTGTGRLGVPAFWLGGELIVGYRPGDTDRRIRTLLGSQAPPTDDAVETRLFGRLSAHELGLPLFTVALGLVDGLNPCAMWVLLFVLALLVNLHSRTKMLLIAGTFVVVSGLAYFVFMAAWLNAFLLLGRARAFEAVLGIVALGIGGLNVKDFVAFGRGPSLSIAESAKPGFYARVRRIVQAENLAAALGGAVVLAVLVNLIELACTAGLPAIYTRILTLHPLSTAEYYAHLALYNLAYVFDDAVMLSIAVVTLGRRKLQQRAGRWLKLLSGTVMIALGVALLAGVA